MKKTIVKNWFVVLLILASFVITVFVVIKGFMPKRYNLEVGDVCPVDIYATGIIMDKLTTEKLRTDASDYVQKQYSFDLTVSDEVEKSLEKALSTVSEFWEKYDEASQLSESEISLTSLDREDWQILLSMSKSELERFSKSCTEATEETMKNGLDEQSPDEAYAFLSESLNKKNLSHGGRRVAYNLISALLKPNKTYDAEATKKAKETAASEIDPVVYQKGEKIIGRGERIEEADYAMMKEMGYIQKTDISTMFTYISLIFVILLLFFYFFYFFKGKYVLSTSRKAQAAAVISTYGIMLLILHFFTLQSDFNYNLFPMLTLAIVSAILCKGKIASLLHFLICAVVTLTIRGELSFFLVNLTGGTILISLLKNVRSRTKIFIHFLPVACFEAVMLIAWEMMENNVISDAVMNGIYIAIGVYLSGVVAMGILPVLESIFHVLTPFRLLEMTNSEHPLLMRLMIEAPGTYQHSLMVGNLAENAAMVVGADPLLTRVGAYYHDVGKLKRPIMFKENQLLDNPHDKLSPLQSAEIILKHPQDGVKIAQQYKLPKQLTDFIAQHHGTTATMYFYQKAKEATPDVSIEPFRYQGPKPQKREMIIVMLADTVEAAVRTMTDDSVEAMEQYVDRLVEGKLREGQLSECNITMAELELIKESFVHTLQAYYHKRVSYQEIDNEN